MTFRAVRKSEQGFSLIELLVIIAIIGLLSSVALANLRDARESARDATIKQQVAGYVTLLELELAQTGQLQNSQTGWVGRGPGAITCAAETYTGPRAEEFRKLCESMISQTFDITPNIIFVGVNSGSFNTQTQYSVMVLLNNNNWHCRGSSGNNYEGPFNGGLGAGCWNNP